MFKICVLIIQLVFCEQVLCSFCARLGTLVRILLAFLQPVDYFYSIILVITVGVEESTGRI